MVRETTRGRIGRSLPEKELNIRQRRWLELIKNYDWEILYHSGKANVVAGALSKKERLKMIMSLGEFIRDFEKMEIEVKDDPDYGEEEGTFRLRKQKSSKERRPETGIQEEQFKDNVRGLTRRKDESMVDLPSLPVPIDLENELSSKQVSFVDVMSLMVATDWANQLVMADLAIAGQLDKAASSLLNRRIPL
ncbi:hypothetical protein AgCh_025986 [Apium graveolens]